MSQLALFTFAQRFFCKTGSKRIFFLTEVFIFSASDTDYPIVGASDMSQVSTLYLGQDLVHFKYFYLLKKNQILSFFHKGEVLKDIDQNIPTKEFIYDPVITQDLVCFI